MSAPFPSDLPARDQELEYLRARVAVLEQQVTQSLNDLPGVAEALRQAHEQLGATVAACPLPIVALTRDGLITLWNPAAERVFGWTATEVMGQPLPFIPDDKSDEHRAMRQSDLSGAPFTNKEIRRKRKDGNLIDLSVSTAPLHNPAGQIVGIMSIYVDVTERKRTEEALRASQERLDLAVRAHHIGIFDWDIQSNAIVWNDEEERLFGLAPGTFGGRLDDWSTRVLPEDLGRIREEFGACWQQRLPHTSFEFRIVRADGCVRTIEGSGRFVYADDGTPLRMVGVNIDTTDRKAIENDLQARESDLRALLAALPDTIARFNRDLRFTYVSPAAERLTGAPPEFFIGKTHEQAGLSHALAEQLRNSLSRVFENGEPDAVEFQFPSPISGQRHLIGIAVPEHGRDGTVVAALSIVRDVTEQKLSESALRASEERLRLAADAGRVGLWDWDIPNDRVTWSERIYHFHGVAPGAFGGTAADFLNVVHPDDRPMISAHLEHALSKGTEFALEFRTLRPDGAIRWIATRADVLFDAAGTPSRMLGASIDVTERREADAALRRANAELEEFAYAASHDLREPLRTINNYTQMLLRRVPPQADTDLYADFIRGGVRRMELLIDGLLAFSRVVHGETDRQEVALDPVFDDALAVLEQPIRESGAVITREPLPTVPADAMQLGQLLQNVLSNAIKYRRRDDVPRIHISATEQDRVWLVSVTDNGVGFRPEYSERIFGLFKRLHGSDIPGTGVGLGICRRIVERYGGMMWAESAGEGQGATFRFTLPRFDSR